MIYLTLPELIHIGERVLSGGLVVRDHGLLEAALARPQTVLYGQETYGSLEEKAAAMVHSLVKNHALVDGNKRLALSGLVAFLGMNGRRLTLSNDEAYDLIVDVASGELDDIVLIAERIGSGTEARMPRTS